MRAEPFRVRAAHDVRRTSVKTQDKDTRHKTQVTSFLIIYYIHICVCISHISFIFHSEPHTTRA